MLYRVHAANRETGAPIAWEIECGSVEEAEQKAFQAGCLLEKIEAVGTPAAAGGDAVIRFYCRRCGEALTSPKGVGTVDVLCPKCSLRSVLPESDLAVAAQKNAAAGHAIANVEPSVIAAQTNPAIARGALDCPKCGSDLTRKLSVLYSEGTTQIDEQAKIQGRVGRQARGYDLIAAAKTHGSQQTELAKTAAPPQQRPLEMRTVHIPNWFVLTAFFGSLAWIFGTITLLCIYGCSGFAAGLVLAILFALVLVCIRSSFDTSSETLKLREERTERVKKDLAKWKEERERWERSFLCLRCGEKFTPPPQ